MSLIKKVIILGAGGDAKVIAETLSNSTVQSKKKLRLTGFLDDALYGTNFCGLPVFGGLNDWKKLGDDVFFISAIQKVRDMPRRTQRIEEIGIPSERWVNVIHKQAFISEDTVLGKGIFISAFVSIQPGCTVGDFATMRAGAAMGHDSTLGRHGYMGPNSTLCGKSIIKEAGHLGPNAVVLDDKVVGRFAIVGIGAAVTKNIPDFAIAMGNPARCFGYVKGHGICLPTKEKS
jgi:acetyltransferase EpsM